MTILVFVHMLSKINSFLMFNALKGVVGPAVKYLGPAVASWGLNKLFTSNMLQSIVPQSIMPALKSGAYALA